MNTCKMNARMTGVLYILGTVFGVMGAVLGGEVFSSLVQAKPLEDVVLLQVVGENAVSLRNGAFFTLLMGISLASMTIFLYPVIRKDSEELALGMVMFRGVFEGVWYLMTTLSFVFLLLLGNEYVASGSPSAELEQIGEAIYHFLDKLGPVGTILFLIGATCLYVSFYRTRLIPRWLTIWGLIGVIPYFAYAFFHFFDLDDGIGFYLQMILALQELVMGFWLVIKGFDKGAVTRLNQS